MKISIVGQFCSVGLILLLSFTGFSQRERIHLDLDKYSCKAGDTVYFKGVIFKGTYPRSASTNLYIQLYTDSGKLLQRSVFPIGRSQSVGQGIFPATLPTANYYFVAFTREQLNFDTTDFFSVPVLVYNRAKPAVVHHKREILTPSSVTSGTIKGIFWQTTQYKGKLSSLLAIDSGSKPRRLRLIDPLSPDSAIRTGVELSSALRQQYCLFPLHPEKDSEVLFLLEDSILIGRQVIRLKAPSLTVQLFKDTLDLSPFGYNSWRLVLPGEVAWYTSISVTDADRTAPSPKPITELNGSYTDDYTIKGAADTAYIDFLGKATRQSGKKIKSEYERQIVVAGVRDTNYLFMKTVDLDTDGNFRLDSLFFFGTIGLKFQLNGEQDASGKDIKLRLTDYVPSINALPAITTNWEDDTTMDMTDTAITTTEQNNNESSKVKTLKAAIVRHWKNPRQQLDDTYTTGSFSEPALYYYDLRNDSSDYNRDIFSYISAHNGRLYYDIAGDSLSDVLGHPIHYFVDEQEYPPFALRMFDFDRLAYIKILESDFLSNEETRSNEESRFNPAPPSISSSGSPKLGVPVEKTAVNICIYTRKGKDFRTMRGGMTGMPIKGYTPIIPFQSDEITLYWRPLETGHSFNIKFSNTESTRRFRVRVDAMTYQGQVIHYETVISK
jgi:hypothetical protein